MKVILLSKVAENHIMKRKLFKRGIKRQSPNSKEAVGIFDSSATPPGQPESLFHGVLKDPHQSRACLPRASMLGLL